MRSSSPLLAASINHYEDLYAQYRRDPSSVHESWRVVCEVIDELDARDTFGVEGLDKRAFAASHWRDRGHLEARLDPLQPFVAPAGDEHLRALYTGALALETAHIDDEKVRSFCRAAFESRGADMDTAARLQAIDLLLRAEEFERRISARYPTKKRFGAEGSEAILPLLDRILHQAAAADFTDVVIGTMHRGRLSIIANVLQKPLQTLFEEIIGGHPLDDPAQPADVPYHLGYDGTRDFPKGSLRLSLSPNPSHLEAINPVVTGRARARQDSMGQSGQVLCILLHTDTSVIGQGNVAETLQLSEVPGFAVGGTLHLIINNQIGFTTNPDEARSSRYCTGTWKAVDSPILHVNGDRIDDVLHAADLAVAFRTAHKRDVVVDLVCYRRNGHNELDQPRFTQPVEYQTIDQHPGVVQIYAEALAADGLITPEQLERQRAAHTERFAAALEAARASVAASPGEHRAKWPPQTRAESPTGVNIDQAADMIRKLATIPEGMQVDRKLAQIVHHRVTALTEGLPWALGEALAFATLLEGGHPVRLSGQDVVRGAFSHRHFAVTDTGSGQQHIALNHLSRDQARFDVINSPLSEYAVLGFEYGYSVERPEALTIWEAQFGDFANGAQIVIDQFIASGQAKWGQRSGLVLLLPHGLEGQGPEHSSARPERFLQLAADGNFDLAHPSTPANYFHLLRRQISRDAAIPLVILSPKTLLRLPAALSPLEDFATGTAFQPIITTHGTRIDKILLCSGKIAYELEAERIARGDETTAIVRLEMLYPLPEDELLTLLRPWREAHVIWVQEEPCNYGAWQYLDRRLEALLERAGARAPRVTCVARPEQSSPAGSFHGRHDAEQQALIARAFDLYREPVSIISITGSARA